MFKQFGALFRVFSRAMSKKFKSENFQKMTLNCADSPINKTDNQITCRSSDANNCVSLNGEGYSYVRFLDVPVKSASDKKEYSVIKLENGLVALLISDNYSANEVVTDLDRESDNEIEEELSGAESEDDVEMDHESEKSQSSEEKLAACSLTVEVGSFNDPADIPGMAHFLEHMIFMGSKKYPQENYLDSYIKKKGGSDNASTECECTTYYFECPDKHLSKTMDIFSNLFVFPLMTESAITREREAVESEFNENLSSDSNRRQQLLQSCATPGHPAGKFVWGNLETLKNNITDSYLYEATHLFWKTYYSSNKMSLAVQARLPLEILEKMVAKHFSSVPHNVIEPPKIQVPTTPFDLTLFHQIYYVECVKDNISLELNWVMPPVRHLFKTKPTSYISWTIGHEGKGSLLAYLRKKLWATGLSAGHDDDDLSNNKLYSLFTININLTELGAENVDAILNAVFSYTSMLKKEGPVERIFKEMQRVAEINFRFEEETAAVDNVESLSSSMIVYPIFNYINGSELLFEYDPEEIRKFMEYIDPRTVNIMFSNKKHNADVVFDKKERWFSTKYTCKPIPNEQINDWLNIELFPEFHLPEPNQYITSDFSLRPFSTEDVMYPKKIFDSAHFSIWYKQDNKFRFPTGFIGFQFVNKDILESPFEVVLLKVYSEMLSHLLNEELYPSSMALLEYKIEEKDGFLLIEVNGFNEKLNILLDKIVEYINKFNDIVSEELLSMHKETRLKIYYNSNLKVYNLCNEVRRRITVHNYFTSAEKFYEVSKINIEDVKKFSEKFYKKAVVQCLVQGNILKDEAMSICHHFVNKLEFGRQSLVEKPNYLVPILPYGEYCCRVKGFDPSDPNCATTNYYQFGTANVKEYCTIELLLLLLEEPLFDQLRTQEQLGYDVRCTIREVSGVVGFTITVISQINKQSVDHVESRISHFLTNQLEIMKTMPLSEFNEAVSSLICLKKHKDLNLKEEVNRNWFEIKCFEYAFDRLQKSQKVLETITPSDVISVLERYVERNNPNFRKLTVQIEGYHSESNDINNISPGKGQNTLPKELHFKMVTPERENSNFIEDIHKFRSPLPFYPESKIFGE